MPVTSDDVANAYRWLLGREPDKEGFTAWLGTESREELRLAFVASPEFLRTSARPRTMSPSILPGLPGERLPRLQSANHVEWQADRTLEAQLVAYIERTWNKLGDEKPHWSVLSTERFLPKNIVANSLEFYKSGADDVDLITNILRNNCIEIGSLRSVVEYGCGVGRVTPFLAERFQDVTAIDISESHIAMARHHCADHAGIKFEMARSPEYGMIEPFDLWFSYIVLQHNPPPIIARILARAFKMLAPGGVAIFQVPTWCDGYRFRVSDYLSSRPAEATIEVHCLPQHVIFGLAHDAGCVPIEIRGDGAMRPPAWASHVFVFRKEA